MLYFSIIVSIVVSIFALVFVFFLIRKIKQESAGSGKMIEISQAIKQGTKTFLKKEFKIMIPVLLFIALGLGFLNHGFLGAMMFLVGAGISSLAGYLGMMIATDSNSRVAQAARKSFPKSFQIAFLGGSVMGFLVVGLGLLGVSIIWFLFEDVNLLLPFAFGASLVALFMRVGGGIFTKSADVGADLVGKIEKDIPEDDPRNPAVIADNVGDNVGDIAGMGADLFESYISAIIAAMVIGVVAFGQIGLVLPLMLAAAGILSSILGSFFVRISRDLENQSFTEQIEQIRKAMEKGVIVANFLMVVAAFFIVLNFFGAEHLGLFWALLVGLGVGLLIGKSSEYYTSAAKKPVKRIAESSLTGAPTVIIEGWANGMKSVSLPVLGVAIATILAYHFGELYGIALASVGILAVLGINLSTDCYGPIVDNAAGISEMAGLEKEARQRTEALDAVGNTTAATGKGFAIGSAALVALAWLSAFFALAGLETVNLLDSKVIAGLFIGAMISFLFCSLTLESVGRGAQVVIKEVRRQFKEIPGIMENKAKPDYNRCVDLITGKALREMILPGALVVLSPILVGLILGIEALGGVLAGSLITGFLLALFMANAGGAWDNAKKYIESGNLGGKGSDAHKAAVVGDTVGDPFKDTTGPSLNILIKLIGIVSIISLAFFL